MTFRETARDLKAQDTSGKARTDMAGHTDLSSPPGYSPAFCAIPWACARDLVVLSNDDVTPGPVNDVPEVRFLVSLGDFLVA